MRKYILILLIALSSLNLYAKDGVPFIHSFGELRVYFKDWLVVCADKGEGECRMVNYVNIGTDADTGFFPESRLTITPNQRSKPTSLDFYHKDAPSQIDGITVSVDSEKFLFDAEDYQTPTQSRIMETYIIKNETKLEKMIMESKLGRWLRFTYYKGDNYKSVNFSLRGFSKAYEFIKKQRK